MLLKCLGLCGSKHIKSGSAFYDVVPTCSTSSYQRPYPTVIEELCHQFSLADLRKSTNNFDDNQIIGEGCSGVVYKGCLQHNGATNYTVALKRMYKIPTGQEFKPFKKEIELLCQLRHPNLVSLIGFCDHGDEKIVVYEYMANGSLHDHLYCSDMKMEPLSWMQRLKICIGAAHGLHYLHTGAKRPIIHSDIRPHNILLDNNMVPKLSDFENSLLGPLLVSSKKPILIRNCSFAGTYGYAAPEYAYSLDVTDKRDVYSFGNVLLEVVCAKHVHTIFEKLSEVENQNVWKGQSNDPLVAVTQLVSSSFAEFIDPVLIGKIAPECWEVFMDIAQRCLNVDPNERPIMGEVEVQLEHALSLQEEADLRNTTGEYTLLSTTILTT